MCHFFITEYVSSNLQDNQAEMVEFDTVMALDFFAGCLGGKMSKIFFLDHERLNTVYLKENLSVGTTPTQTLIQTKSSIF